MPRTAITSRHSQASMAGLGESHRPRRHTQADHGRSFTESLEFGANRTSSARLSRWIAAHPEAYTMGALTLLVAVAFAQQVPCESLRSVSLKDAS